MLTWAARFNICCFLDNHHYDLPGHSVECLLAAGSKDTIQANAGNALGALHQFTKTYSGDRQDWLFGHFGYGLVRETEPDTISAIRSQALKPDPVGFPDLFFFVPEILIELASDHIRIGTSGHNQPAILDQILQVPLTPPPAQSGVKRLQPALSAIQEHSGLSMLPRFREDEYLQTVEKLQAHILRGDCYEINFCQEFFSQPAVIDPLRTWWLLSETSPNPFAGFYRLGERFLLCASPERYLKRTGDTIISQPIKGTSPRAANDPAADSVARDQLYKSSKDRSENVMVVDLVRNDLSKICREGTVGVTELFGIYSFPHVHQMISTVQGTLNEGVGLADCIRATFPMGSMTGAPKHKVVSLIDQYERSARGLYSGAIGYVSPTGDFDFNVVIRSILYNHKEQYLSYQVGSGITYYSDPHREYDECLLKAEGMRRALL